MGSWLGGGFHTGRNFSLALLTLALKAAVSTLGEAHHLSADGTKKVNLRQASDPGVH